MKSLIVPTLITLVGVLLLVYMVTFEGEPGALPLLLVLAGVSWLVVVRVRNRARVT